MPVAAVRNGGSPTVSSGSRMARLGISHGLKMMIFRPSLCEVITEDRPTSLPVPEVVGIAMMGSYGHRDPRQPIIALVAEVIALALQDLLRGRSAERLVRFIH